EPSPARPAARRRGSAFPGLDDLAPAVGAAVRARPVAQGRLATLRAGDHVRRRERVVRAPLVALARRGPALGYGHAVLLLCPASLPAQRDRKSTRLNSSHEWISYAVFCLNKK